MLAATRREQLLTFLKRKKNLSILELADTFSVSLNTIRSDINILHKAYENHLVRVHGGILWQDSPSKELEAHTRRSQHSSEKTIIGELAARRLASFSKLSVVMDSSTTTLEVARAIVPLNLNGMVLSYSIDVISVLSGIPELQMFGLGGRLWMNEHCFVGRIVINQIKEYRATVAILGVSGLDMQFGLFNGNEETVEIKQEIINAVQEVWIVCDHSKFNLTFLMPMCSFDAVKCIITDQSPSLQWLNFFKIHGIDCVYPPENQGTDP